MISFHKIYGLYGLKHHAMEINGDVTIMHPLLIANMNLIYPGDHIFTGVDLIDGIWTAGDEQQYKKRT